MSLISKVGGDAFAQMALKSLIEYKVDTEYVFFAEAKSTGVIVTLVNAEGENAVAITPGPTAPCSRRTSRWRRNASPSRRCA